MQLPSRSCAAIVLCMAALLLTHRTVMAQSSAPPAAKPQTSSNWKLLQAREKQALAPLAERWDEISETQRNKWLTIARSFDQLSVADQQVMQARMKEWAALSPVQRNQARLNFNHLQNLPKDEKKSRWGEYQSLSEEEKRKLSAGAMGPARTAAPSPKPMAAERLVQPTVRTVPPAALPPRTPIDRHTLLPLPAAPTPVPAANTAPAPLPSPDPAPAEGPSPSADPSAREASAS